MVSITHTHTLFDISHKKGQAFNTMIVLPVKIILSAVFNSADKQSIAAASPPPHLPSSLHPVSVSIVTDAGSLLAQNRRGRHRYLLSAF